jgi:hypothetical protein
MSQQAAAQKSMECLYKLLAAIPAGETPASIELTNWQSPKGVI